MCRRRSGPPQRSVDAARRPSYTIHNGAEGDSKRPDRQADRGRRPGIAIAPRRPSAGQQGREEHGFLQSSIAQSACSCTVTYARVGVQRPHSTLQSRHAHTRTHHSPTRPLLPLLTPHASHRNAPPVRRWCRTYQKQGPWSRKCTGTDEQPRWAEGQNKYEQSDCRQCRQGHRRHSQLEACL